MKAKRIELLAPAFLPLLAAAILTLAICASPAAAAGKPPASAIGPGAKVMTAEEAAIVPDPNTGAQHAVILLEETEQDDAPLQPLTRYHLRAKILSNDGRGLADVRIPLLHPGGHLVQWWGRTILPDGGIVEIPQEMLVEKVAFKTGRWESHSLSAALAGVEPGCVIDYGYVLRDTTRQEILRLPLEKPWPVRKYRYRWNPFPGYSATSLVRRETSLAVDVHQEGTAFVVEASNLKPLPDEPAAPPEAEIRSAVTFYYVFIEATSANDFWNAVGRWLEDTAKTFNSYALPLENAIRVMNIPADANLTTKLKIAYDWLADNVKDTRLRSAEEMEIAREGRRSRIGTSGAVLKARQGDTLQLGLTYMGLARTLGAEASLVLAPDRTIGDWRSGLLSTDQIGEILVAVKAPGAGDDSYTFVDPSSGLAFGEIPWWATGGKASMTLPAGARQIDLKPTSAGGNRAETKADLSVKEDGSLSIRWSRACSGQEGYQERVSLRRMTPEDRAKRLDETCGAARRYDVSVAESAGLDDLKSPFRLRCEGALVSAEMDPAADELRIEFAGPWIEPLPDLSSSERHYPVIFPYPRTEVLTLDIAAPAGFAPGEVPPPVEIDGSFGSYRLGVSAAAMGFRVERTLTLSVTRVEPRSYPALQAFLLRIQRADKTILGFTRAGGPSS